MGLLFYYKNKGDLNGIKTIARWCIEFSENTRKTKDPCFYDKINCACLTAESYAYFKSGDKEKTKKLLTEAYELAVFFDSSEEKIKDIIKLFDSQQEAALFSILGENGMESVESTLDMISDKKFTSLWNSIRK